MRKALRELRTKRQRSRDMMEEVAAARDAEAYLKQRAADGAPLGGGPFTSDDLRQRAAELRGGSSAA